MPGSPFQNPRLTEAQRERIETQYGLNDPVLVQYTRYMGNVLKLEFGGTIATQEYEDIFDDYIKERLPLTAQIGGMALLIGTTVGIVFGALAALRRNSWIDNSITILGVIGISIPSFVFAAFLQEIFSIRLGWLPLTYQVANETLGYTVRDEYMAMILPVIALAVGPIASIMRYMRTELVEVFSSDYILLAQAKGLSKSSVVFKHAIRNALIPVITIIGPMSISLITGSLVVEQFFAIPGLSNRLVQFTIAKETYATLGINFFYSFMYVFVILIVDILYGIIDPRIRLAANSDDGVILKTIKRFKNRNKVSEGGE
jgi:oligopeptide transport system permease protein